MCIISGIEDISQKSVLKSIYSNLIIHYYYYYLWLNILFLNHLGYV